MNKRQKEIVQTYLNDEKEVIKKLQQIYKDAKRDCESKIAELNARKDMQNLQSIIYQKRYQEALKKQIDAILQNLQTQQYASIKEYLEKSYEEGFVGTLYDIHGQGIPLIFPINQEEVIQAVQTDSKISEGLYSSMGEDVTKLKDNIRMELSRGISNGSSWIEMAEYIAFGMNSPFNKAINHAVLIARTEGHRIQNQAALNCQKRVKEAGAEIVKQWDATLDRRTRLWHQEADGQIKEVEEKFFVGGEWMDAPGVGGSAKNVCNCRCCLLQRARWALNEEELDELKERAAYFGIDKTRNFKDFKKRYMKAQREYIAKDENSGIIKPKSVNEESAVAEIRNLGKINTKVLEKEFGKIQTDDIIVTNERINHIKERHPEDYNLFEKYGKDSVSSPDLIIKDIKNKGTVFMVKKLPETNLNVVVRVVLETDDNKLKNSVMTFYRIRERNLKKLIEKNGMLYKKE